MESFVYKRLFGTLNEEAKKLRQKEGNEVNPTGERKEMAYGHAFKDNGVYVYSLYNLDSTLSALTSYLEYVSEKRESDDEGCLYKCETLPLEIAFNLRGYIGAFSEENMLLERKRLKKLGDVLEGWFDAASMNSGKEQNKLYQFLWDFAKTKICDVDPSSGNDFSKEEKSEFMKLRVNTEMKAFKEILEVSGSITWDIFNNANKKVETGKTLEVK
jgi:hypothetical protein